MTAKQKGKRKKFYITTAIAYVNAPPHIGFALESVQADAIARFKRSAGYDVHFLTGTDEHGDKIARAAREAGRTPRAFANAMSVHFKKLKRLLDLSWDDFIRTSETKRHYPGALALWRELERSGALYRKRYRGLYCVGCEKFITEKELVGGLCPYHQKEPEVFEEDNFFFRLSRYAKRLEKAIASGKYRVAPESRKNEVLSFIRSGLEDV
ncbi:MAG: class I tRNA ligase family protein, partial [Candidatus Colwellbacteria bacterium]|nr:class I tRNA ligase family protein [Candidatus Colwellbacteria bacterium]